MVKRGDIYFADLSPVVGSEQGGVRPVLVVQNNLGNHFSPTIIVAAITAKWQSQNCQHISGLILMKQALKRFSDSFRADSNNR